MKINRNFYIWFCFIASNLLSVTGFEIFLHGSKSLADILIVISLIFFLGFLLISGYEIIKSPKFSKAEKVLWPLLIIFLSVFGQIAYMVVRKRNLKE
jgi:hypothetical protein